MNIKRKKNFRNFKENNYFGSCLGAHTIAIASGEIT